MAKERKRNRYWHEIEAEKQKEECREALWSLLAMILFSLRLGSGSALSNQILEEL